MNPGKGFPFDLRLTSAILIGPSLFYFAFYAVASLADTALGDGLILSQLKHFSKRELLSTFVEDWAASLPVAYGVSLPLIGLALLARSRRHWRIIHSLPALSIMSSIGVSLVLFGGQFLAIFVAVALTYSIPAAWLLERFGRA